MIKIIICIGRQIKSVCSMHQYVGGQSCLLWQNEALLFIIIWRLNLIVTLEDVSGLQKWALI